MTDTTRRAGDSGLPDTLFLDDSIFGGADEELTDEPLLTDAEKEAYYGPVPRQPAENGGLELRTVGLGGRRYNFRQIPDHVLWHPELQPSEVVFYGKLMFFAAEKGYCTYSVPFMAAACGVSDRSIQNWEKHLEELGLIRRKFRKMEGHENRNDNNVLTVVEEPEVEPEHAFRHKDVVKSVKHELVRRREEKAEKKGRGKAKPVE